MNHGHQETPEEKLTRLQIEKLEKEKASAKAFPLFIAACFIVPFVGYALLALLGFIVQALR